MKGRDHPMAAPAATDLRILPGAREALESPVRAAASAHPRLKAASTRRELLA